MGVLVSKTFSVVTEESAKHGDVGETGFKYENRDFSFGELVVLMRDHYNPSSWPAQGGEYEWYSDNGTVDFVTGDEETCSIHYSRKNEPRKLKYWRKAAIVAGIVKP